MNKLIVFTFSVFLSLVVINSALFAQMPGNDYNKNWIYVKTFDGNGYPISESVSYFDRIGRGIQTQSKLFADNYTNNKVMASQIVYDAFGRPVLTTLSAPINQSNLNFKDDFITNSSGANYSYLDFDLPNTTNNILGESYNPKPTSNTDEGTLGWYYSNNNAWEAYVPASAFPYSRVEYSKLNPGATRKSTLAGEHFKLGSGHEAQSYSMLANFNEIQGYTSIAEYPNVLSYNHVIKSIGVDQNGKQSVSFTSLDEQLLATCVVDPAMISYSSTKYFAEGVDKPFIDVHIAKDNDPITYSYNWNESTDLTIYDLSNDEELSSYTKIGSGSQVINLDAGFYRLVVQREISETETLNASITYKNYYTDFAFYYYDQAGRMIKSVAPEGHQSPVMHNTFTYNAAGWLLSKHEAEFGEDENQIPRVAEFVYKKDGQIKFSQNPKQKEDGKFSYTNYDKLGRVVESGEYDCTGGLNFVNQLNGDPTVNTSVHYILNNNFSYTDPLADGLNDAYCSDQTFFKYDTEDPDLASVLSAANIASSNYKQTFTIGALSKSWNENIETWYSYDEMGRVLWMIQNIAGLGVKIIDYTYDFNGDVLKVEYQKNNDAEMFTHMYEYDEMKRLTEVRTQRYDATQTQIIEEINARYHYYEHGALKRIELSIVNDVPLQGIDYIYTLNGWLKMINSPNLSNLDPNTLTHLDPGGDTNDIFGLALDYFDGDYKRNGTYVNYGSGGGNLYNGNIKASHWKIDGQEANDNLSNSNDYWTYQYKYNNKDWFTEATFGTTSPSFSINNIDGNGSTTDVFTPDATGNYHVSNLTYDRNGNILSLNRKAYPDPTYSNNDLDDLSYHYDWVNPADHSQGLKSNKLLYITDANTGGNNISGTITDDIETQATDNYTYNKIGQLVQDKSMTNNPYITYNVSGLVSGIFADAAHTQAIAEYYYDDRGFRLKKKIYNSGTLAFTDLYVRDANGSIMSMYRTENTTTTQTELPLYASTRVGVLYKGTDKFVYELADHLGNVRATIARGETDLLSYSDYYPFGYKLPGETRNLINSDNYRFGYQGQFAEKDEETGWDAFEARMWNGKIGRWMAMDPAGQYASSYLGMGNNPIMGVDMDGAFWQELWNFVTFRGWKSNARIAFAENHPDWTWDSETNRFGKIYSSIPDGASGKEIGISPYFGPVDDFAPIGIGSGFDFAIPKTFFTKRGYGIGRSFAISFDKHGIDFLITSRFPTNDRTLSIGFGPEVSFVISPDVIVNSNLHGESDVNQVFGVLFSGAISTPRLNPGNYYKQYSISVGKGLPVSCGKWISNTKVHNLIKW